MIDHRPLIDELRGELDGLAHQAPLANPDQPDPSRRTQVLQVRRWAGGKTVGVALLAAAALAVVLITIDHHDANRHQIVTAGQPPSTPASAATSTPATSSTSALPHMLPASAATLTSIRDIRFTKPAVSNPASGYVQAFEGPPGPATARMVITTVVAAPDALAGYAASATTVTVRGQRAFLEHYPTHRQLLWQEPSGVVVSIESINVDDTALTSVANAVEPRPAAQLGVDVAAALPDGLFAVGSGALDTNGLNRPDVTNIAVTFQQDRCRAILEIVHGDPADYEAIAISAGEGRSTVVQGRPGVQINWGPADNNLVTVLWSPGPGVILRLQGNCTNISNLAAELHPVADTVWDQAVASLGAQGQIIDGDATQSVAPTVPPTATGQKQETFGIAH